MGAEEPLPPFKDPNVGLPRLLIAQAAGEIMAVAAEGDFFGDDPAGIDLEEGVDGSTFDIPDINTAIFTAGDQSPAIMTEDH